MKTSQFLFLLILAVFTVSSVGVSAQDKTEQDKSKIFINKKGEIYDHGWTKLGYITKDNIVKNNKGQKLYFIDRDGNVIDAAGKNIGKAAKNGNYYNAEGVSIIQVRDKDAELCEILDPEGHNLGTVHKNYKLHACAAHCIFLMKKKEKEVKN